MPTAGDRLEMVDGSVYEVLRTAADTGGEFVEMIFHLPSGCVAPPPHVHSGLVEEYEVLEGGFDVMVDGNWRTLGPGGSASVPEGAVHTFRNRSGSPARVRNFHRPAAKFDLFIEHMYRLIRARGLKRKNDPRVPSYLSMLILEYPETLAPGRAQERFGLKALAGLGRLLGMRTAVRLRARPGELGVREARALRQPSGTLDDPPRWVRCCAVPTTTTECKLCGRLSVTKPSVRPTQTCEVCGGRLTVVLEPKPA